MRKHFIQISINLMLGALLVSCSTVQNAITNTPTPMTLRTPTRVATLISTSTLTATPKPAFTPLPTTVEQVTLEAFGPLCIGSKEVSRAEISPNGEWIAALCYWENEDETEQSPLQVISVDRSKEWKIYYRDYGKVYPGDRHDGILPYRWSKDGRYLYAVAASRASGCCWIGGRYILLVRLNLETGEQIEILNGTDFGNVRFISFTISENDRFLLFTPLHRQPYDFALLDLLTWETKTVTLEPELAKDIDLEFALMSPENIIVLPLFKHIEFNDYKVDAIGMIDMTTGEQTLLVSNLKPDQELYPIRWMDASHVLFSSANPYIWYEQESATYWLLNIRTGELTQINRP